MVCDEDDGHMIMANNMLMISVVKILVELHELKSSTCDR